METTDFADGTDAETHARGPMLTRLVRPNIRARLYCNSWIPSIVNQKCSARIAISAFLAFFVVDKTAGRNRRDHKERKEVYAATPHRNGCGSAASCNPWSNYRFISDPG
jgi:hypothetical protein